MQQAAALGCRHHGNGVGLPHRAQVGALERIHGDVDFVGCAADPVRLLRETDLLADVEHRRLVALAFADHDGAVDGDGVHLLAHGLDGHLIGQVPFALPQWCARTQSRLAP